MNRPMDFQDMLRQLLSNDTNNNAVKRATSGFRMYCIVALVLAVIGWRVGGQFPNDGLIVVGCYVPSVALLLMGVHWSMSTINAHADKFNEYQGTLIEASTEIWKESQKAGIEVEKQRQLNALPAPAQPARPTETREIMVGANGPHPFALGLNAPTQWPYQFADGKRTARGEVIECIIEYGFSDRILPDGALGRRPAANLREVVREKIRQQLSEGLPGEDYTTAVDALIEEGLARRVNSTLWEWVEGIKKMQARHRVYQARVRMREG